MSIRRFNQTGRKKIAREHASFALSVQNGGYLAYTAKLQLHGYQFAPSARVLIEAYRQLSYERFDHGPAGSMESSISQELRLFRDGDQVQFRVKVIDSEGTEGCLLGEADRLKPELGDGENGDRISLLPTECRDLGEEAWCIEFDDGPLLLVNNRLGDYRQLARTPSFVWLVYPAALRQVLRHILVDEGHRSVDDPQDWKDQWLSVAGKMRGSTELPSEKAESRIVEDWITDAVGGFARRHKMLDSFGRQTFNGDGV